MSNMSLYDQITNLLDKSQKILLLTHAKADCDGLGAALSASLILKDLGKEVTVATNDPTPDNLQFLPAMNILQYSLSSKKDFVISLNTDKTPVGKIKYNVEGNQVNIIITPKTGAISEKDLAFSQGAGAYDLIFVFDSGNLEHLGTLYEQNTEMFFEIPVINIDHHPSNTEFGRVNMVDVTASSTTEILLDFFQYMEKKYNKKLITEDIATLLLAGIITDTGSFQHANTSPKAMENAARLLDLGARQQEIIKNIYKTKKLSTLKLWGIILSKVQVDPIHRMVWSAISKDDLQEAEASPEETEGIIDDLLSNAPGAEVIFLIKQNPDHVSVSMRSSNNQTDVGRFCAEQGGGGHVRAGGFKVAGNRPFDEAVNEVIGKVRKFQAERLNIELPSPPSETPIVEKTDEKQTVESVKPTEPPIAAPAATPQEEPKTTYLDFPKPPRLKAEPTPPIPKIPSKESVQNTPKTDKKEAGAPVENPNAKKSFKPKLKKLYRPNPAPAKANTSPRPDAPLPDMPPTA